TILILSAVIVSIALAQTPRNNDDDKLKARNAPDVFIYSASAFGPDKNGDSNFTIDVGNTGRKIVTSIVWEYDPSRDDRGSADDSGSRHSFRNNFSALQPNQRTKMTNKVHRYTDKFVSSFHLGTVRIVEVNYED